MKLLHIADLHIGKRLNEFNLIDDQRYILEQILAITKDENPDGVLIAGDVYDKSQPSAEAVELLDWFLTSLTELGCRVFMISGNHDSPERLGFGSQIMKRNGLYIAGVFDGSMKKIMLEDEHGVVNIYLLPFIKPAMVRPYFEEQIDSYDEAVRKVISAENIDTDQRNVLVAHQFVVKGSQLPEQSESEYPSVGGLDYVDASAFKNFDYVALGHLHRSQSVDSGRGYYAGSPLKYSVSEAVNHKSVLIIELAGKESEIIKRRVKLTPKRDVLKIKGYIDDVLNAAREQGQVSQDFVHVTLTDDDDIFDPLGQLRQVYPNLIGIDFENSRTELQSSSSQIAAAKELETLTPLDLFVAFYQLQNNKEMNSEQLELMKELFDKARGASV